MTSKGTPAGRTIASAMSAKFGEGGIGGVSATVRIPFAMPALGAAWLSYVTMLPKAPDAAIPAIVVLILLVIVPPPLPAVVVTEHECVGKHHGCVAKSFVLWG